MDAKKLIEKGSFGPSTLHIVYQAFDDAWNEIAANYSPDQVEAARTRLAKVLMSLTTHDMTDAETLKRLALEGMAKPTS